MNLRKRVLGIVGGSGLYELEGLTRVRRERVSSPFGEPSDELLFGELEGQPVVFLPRHGRGHRLAPGDINYRANIDALKRAGVTELLSLSAVGSLREDLPPGTFVIVDQFVDRTLNRPRTFFGTGLVAHVSHAQPVCRRLGDSVEQAARGLSLPVSRGGTYLVIEGPQFSTLAESRLYRSWGCDVIGMTNMPEARLAREAELCYATVAMVTDFDCWHPEHDAVTLEQVTTCMARNAANARALVRAVAQAGADLEACEAGCDRALEHALITAPEVRDRELLKRLDAVAGRVLNAQGDKEAAR